MSTICLMQNLLGEFEFNEYMNLMTLINCTDDGDNEFNNNMLNDIENRYSEMCKNWSGNTYFVAKSDTIWDVLINDEYTKVPITKWVLYIADAETGVAVDVEDVFDSPIIAAESGYKLENMIEWKKEKELVN